MTASRKGFGRFTSQIAGVSISEAEQELRDVGDEEPGKEAVDEVRMLGEQERPGLQPVDQQAAEQDRGGIGAGNAEGEHRDQRRAGDRVVGRLGRGDRLRRAVAELLRMLRPALGLVVGHERRDRAAGAGHAALEDADAAADELRRPGPLQHRPAGEHDPRLRLRRFCPVRRARLDQQLADGEHADHDEDESMPPRSSDWPKVKRRTPDTGSVPTVATISPSTPPIRPFTSDPSVSEAMTLRPRMPSAK